MHVELCFIVLSVLLEGKVSFDEYDDRQGSLQYLEQLKWEENKIVLYSYNRTINDSNNIDIGNLTDQLFPGECKIVKFIIVSFCLCMCVEYIFI